MSHRIMFIHIPKTAGSTFNGILSDHFTPKRTFHVFGGSITTASKYYNITKEVLSNLDMNIVANVDLIYGHMPFVDDERFSNFSIITFLRDPVNRVVSDYLYTRATVTHPLHHIVQGLDLSTYVTRRTDLHLDNLQTRLLSGFIEGSVGAEHVEKAEFNLRSKFRYFGLTERFSLSVALLNASFGWKITAYRKENVTGRVDSTITELDLATVVRHNQFDNVLYQRAKGQFDEAVASRGRDLHEIASRITEVSRHRKKSLAQRVLTRIWQRLR